MDSSILTMILLQVALIALNAVFACAEIAVISFNDTKLAKMAESGDKRAKKLVKLTQQPAKFLSTIQVSITLSGFLGSAFAAENFSDYLVNWLIGMGVKIPAATLDTISVVVITLVLSYFTLVFGELVPKQVAMRKSESLALAMASMLSTIAKIFSPIVWMLTVSTNGVLRLLGIDPNQQDESISEEEIRMMVDVGSEKGTIDSDEKEFIQNVFEFDDLTAGELATHRTDTTLLWIEDDIDEWKKTIEGSRFNLYPVCRDSADKIVGVLNAKEYFRLQDRSNKDEVLAKAVRPAYFVPESVKADVLFKNMKTNRHGMAVVLDEYGGMYGIVTMNDLITQLVGDWDDEHEEDIQPDIQQIDQNSWKVRGSALLGDVEEALQLELGEDFDTFGGMVFGKLDSIPEDGSTVEVETELLKIKTLLIKDHQIEWAVVYKKQIVKEDDDDEE